MTSNEIFEVMDPDTVLDSLCGLPRPLRARRARALLKDTRKEVDSYVEKMKQLGGDAAQREHDRLVVLVDELLGCISPIRRLSPEVMAHIFFSCCTDNFLHGCLMPAPMLLAQVCEQWCRLALSTSELWSSMTINLGFVDDLPGGLHLETISLKARLDWFLQLSRQRPLRLTLSMPTESSLAEHVLQILSGHSHRWVLFDLKCAAGLLVDKNFPSVKGNLRQLTRLKIKDWSDNITISACTVFDNLPTIEEVVIGEAVFTSPNASYLTGLSKHRLTHLSLSRTMKTRSAISNELFHRIFFPIYLQLIAKFAGKASNAVISPERPLLIPNVRSASIHASLNPILLSLVLPRLTQLEIHGGLGYTLLVVASYKNIVPFLTRSSSHLTSLSLLNLGIRLDYLIGIIDSLPYLYSLTLHENRSLFLGNGWRHEVHTVFKTRFFQHLIVDVAAPLTSIVLPHLKELDLQFDANHFPKDAFLRMLNSRRRVGVNARLGVDNLTSVTVRMYGGHYVYFFGVRVGNLLKC
ncbi:hypothetical protein D9758_014494 [Tetrapyrgos nigripes]|uniref:F-box domain-containing protein n=1 Tax=Tetrapyrgos nigripes TaxID=182062 RepID=A0A8H5C8U8_9AGAR|nr:hypothetical protein D9758_014494 [Tetrapyrgos nigripes]